MYSRFLPSRLGRRGSTRVASGGFNGNFGALLDSLAGAGTTVGYYRGDLGLTLTGAIVNAWANQIVGASAFGPVLEGGAGVGLGSTTAGVGGRAAIASNGSTRYGRITTVPQPLLVPAVSPLNYLAVMRSLVATPGAHAFLLGVSFNFTWFQPSGTNNIAQFNGTAQQTTAQTINTWGRGVAGFSGTTSDAVKWGAGATVSGVNSGNNGGGIAPIGVFASFDGSLPGTWECALLMFSRAPIASFLAALPGMDAAITSYYGGSVVV